jgi:hypothetical protein
MNPIIEDHSLIPSLKQLGVIFIITMIVNISIGNYDFETILNYFGNIRVYGYILANPLLGG